MEPAIGEVSSRCTLNERLNEFLIEENRLTAIHEAGHASMFWFFQQRYFLRGISMVSTDEYDAIVQRSSITFPGEIAAIAIENPERANRLAMMEAMHALSGPFAENCFGSNEWHPGDFGWLELMFSECLSVFDSLVEMACSKGFDDFFVAVKAGYALHRNDELRIRRFISKCAIWTEQAFQLQGMDDVVNVLAKELIPLRDSNIAEMAGGTVWEHMENAWGDRKRLPILNAPWRRRFSILKGERWWLKSQ